MQRTSALHPCLLCRAVERVHGPVAEGVEAGEGTVGRRVQGSVSWSCIFAEGVVDGADGNAELLCDGAHGHAGGAHFADALVAILCTVKVDLARFAGPTLDSLLG